MFINRKLNNLITFKIEMQQELDSIRLNFDSESLFFLNLTLAVIMFGVALNIRIDDFLRVLKNPKSVIVGFLSQFILLPAVTFLLVLLIKPIPSIALGMFMVAACPGGNISNFMSNYANGNTALSVSLTAIAILSYSISPLISVTTPPNESSFSTVLVAVPNISLFSLLFIYVQSI